MLGPIRFAVALIGCGIFVTACGQESGASPAQQAAPVAASYDFTALLAKADPDKGKVLFLQCRACHSTEQGGANKVGPNLHGVFGRQAGKAPGFAYSEVVTGSDVHWSPETLDRWLTRPSEFLPGNRMVFVGIPKPEDRANLIAYLQRETTAAP